MNAKSLKELIDSKIVVIDGAMGTCLQSYELEAKHFGGADYEGCIEHLCLTNPQILSEIHHRYLEAGADIIETNTFGGTPVVLDEFDLGHKACEINTKAAQLARQAADEWSKKDPAKRRFVAGSIGPTTKAISVTGGISFGELIENFYRQMKALTEGGVDYFLIETCQDTRNIKAALLASKRLSDELNTSIAVAVSGTIEPMGTMLAGQTVEALVTSLEHVELLYLGLNCATGPDFMADHIRTLSHMAPWPVGCVPNAGLPDEEGQYLETPAMMERSLERFLKEGWVNLIGGCCGTTYGHIEAFRNLADKYSPRQFSATKRSALSGVEYLEVSSDNRPILVGERTNVIGSRKFKRLISENLIDEAAEIAKSQVKKGAQIIDVCLADPDRDELSDMGTFLEEVIKKIKVPLMIDSTDELVIEKALQYSQGKAIINSINLEEGEERFQKVIPIVKKYGAAVIVGTIDDDPKQGMGVTRERKLEIATRSYDLLTKKYKINETDIYWDPLVFPCATGDANYVGSAVETIEGIRLIKEKYPYTKTVLGISNVSFGLPAAGREVLNSVFTYLCTQVGLDLALVNTQHFKRYSAISEEEKKLALDLLYDRGDDPISQFVSFYRGKKIEQISHQDLPLKERLSHYILDGTKEGLREDLDLALKQMAPMDIINGPLMEGMKKVGKLFNDNQLIVAEVLQSAESMKAAVSFLAPHMEAIEETKKGKVILATVKGDVHDIGKNLVDIVLTNNGFEVVNLGIKITSDQLIQAIKQHAPDIVGLSGLLVKSAQQMAITADDLKEAGIKLPLVLGGAALSRKFVNAKVSPAYEGMVAYAKDAMNGLQLVNSIVDPELFLELTKKLDEQKQQDQAQVSPSEAKRVERTVRSNKVSVLQDIPLPTDFNKHVVKNTPIEVIWKYINPLMLYGRHLGIKGKIVRLLGKGCDEDVLKGEGGKKALEIYRAVEEVKADYKTSHFKAQAVYQYFKANSRHNEIIIWHPSEQDKELLRYQFPRQDKEDGLCLSDYILPLSQSKKDNLGMFIVTVGEGIMDLSKKLKDKGEYLKSHIVQALALESAEAYAEYLHQRMRSFWGLQDSIDVTNRDLFQSKYHGKRYSFGYPACPSLEDQVKLFDCLNAAGEIDCRLTEGNMMEPESSVSALVFHHREATYFSVGDRDYLASL